MELGLGLEARCCSELIELEAAPPEALHWSTGGRHGWRPVIMLPSSLLVALSLLPAFGLAAAAPPAPCPAVACKDHLGRTHCPGKPQQCEQPSHARCAPCAAPGSHSSETVILMTLSLHPY